VRARLFSITAIMTLALALAGGVGCKPKGTVDPSISEAPPADAWAVYQALEQQIASGQASEADRVAALDKVRAAPDDQTAAYAYARASVAGRVAEGRGLKALKLLEDMRKWGLISIERDPQFQDMAATRMLGTLYVLAGNHLQEGDSEEGLELLEEVVDAYPDSPLNHLRLAEGYIALGDPEPALESLCVAQAGREQLSGEERELLEGLVEDIGGAEMLPCEGDGEAP
jgi:tetratricopeptide (TPR) repeat protein